MDTQGPVDNIFTYVAQGAVIGFYDPDADAYKLVEAGTEDYTCKEATDGASRFDIVGAAVTCGPPQAKQHDIAEGEKVGVQENGKVRLLLKAGSLNVAFDQPLKSVGGGKVAPFTFSATPTADELAQAVALARSAAIASATEDVAVEVKLLQ